MYLRLAVKKGVIFVKRSIPILHTDVRGSGQTVVLLHGFLSSSRYWAKVTDLLEQDYKVIAIDLLGFGDSPKPRYSKYDYKAHIDAINKTLKDQGVAEPFILIGHSMGALIALRYSVMYENRVRRLVLANMPILLGKRELRREIFGSSRLHRFGLEFGVHRVTWGVFKTLYKLRLLPSQVKAKLRENDYFFRHNASSRIRSFYNVIGSTQVAEDLALLRVPAQMLSGSDDRAIYLKNLKERITLSPMIQHAVYGTGHHIPWQMPERIVEKIRIIHNKGEKK